MDKAKMTPSVSRRRQNRAFRSTSRGATLIESVVAVLVVSLIFVPIFASVLVAVRMNNRAETLLLAEADISSAADSLMSFGIDVFSDSIEWTVDDMDEDGYTFVTEDFSGVTVTAVFDDFNMSYRVTIVSLYDETLYVETIVRGTGDLP